jgi:hypothetical protein
MDELDASIFPALFIRAERHLDGVTDVIVLILKGHLIIEEGLVAAIEAKCAKTGYLESARLTFYQKLQLVRALYTGSNVKQDSEDVMETVFDAVEALNTLRNRLAHTLEPKDVMPLLKRIHFVHKEGALSLAGTTILSDLNLALAALTGYIGGLADRQSHTNRTGTAPRISRTKSTKRAPKSGKRSKREKHGR